MTLAATHTITSTPRIALLCAAILGFLSFGAIALRCAGAAAFDDERSAAGTSPDENPSLASDWVLESVTLRNNKTYHGLIEAENEASIDFVEIVRRRGKPMYSVVRYIERPSIASWQRITPAEQETLRTLMARHKNRSRIEARRMEDLPLRAVSRDNTLYWQYTGQWFSLESTADEQTTRRAIVRIEQIFAAYRQILPPRKVPQHRPQVVLFGATSQYHGFLNSLGLKIANPAFFLADFNVIVAGSDMNAFAAEMAKVRRQHESIQQELDAEMAKLPRRLVDLNAQLESAGVSAANRQKIALAEQRKWDDKRRDLRRKITAAERANEARFNQVAGKMFSRLYHEAFHAYLQNNVYPHPQYDVPRWINEGWAQTFEAGQVEADVLRVDAPNPSALSRLKADLQGSDPLPLADLLTAQPTTFVSAHADQSVQAARLYAYSWGLAYYLTILSAAPDAEALDNYVSFDAAAKPAVERFEALIGTPLATFEPRWRRAMLDLDD
jgi:hypothetical protein